MAKTVKQTLMTGLGDGYFQRMITEETETVAPIYDRSEERRVGKECPV